MTERKTTILDQLTPLAPLDLKACKTVGDIVSGMRSCSFGARMLGEVADTLTAWAKDKPPGSVIIYDGEHDSRLGALLRNGLCVGSGTLGPFTSDGFLDHFTHVERALIVGGFPERNEKPLAERIAHAVYVNKDGQCRPGLVRDGHFPDVVFADPTVVIPILAHTLNERLSLVSTRIGVLIDYLRTFGGTARDLASGADVLTAMLNDPECTVMLTLSGAMTVAKMQYLVADLIDTGRISYVAATGALMAHGLVEGSGCRHYKHDPRFSDERLAEESLNRVTDTIEPEDNFDHIEEIVNEVLNSYDGRAPLCSSMFHRDLGAYLVKRHPDQRAVLASAYRRNVPIVTPAFTDSELANDVFVHNARRREEVRCPLTFNQELDTKILFDLATKAKRLGIFTIGGGVPRNNAQNVAPLIEIYNARMGANLPRGMFHYGVRIDPASMFLGHISGCTYREGGTWRKFDFKGQFAEVRCDATIAWPFIQKYAMERLGA